MPFQSDLKKLGLSDKEAAVYEASLELGPSPVQPIARKSKVARATTYLVLDALMNMGLVSKYTEGEKTLFAPEPPRQLLRLVEKQEKRLQDQRGELENLLPKLQAFMRSMDDRPTARYFAGVEGLRTMRREMVMYSTHADIWYNFTPVDHLSGIFGKEEIHTKSRVVKGVRQKTIFTTKDESLKNEIFARAKQERAERKFVAPEKFKSASGLSILKDWVAIGSFTGKIGGVVIESQSVADMMKELFSIAWENLDDQK